MLEMITGVTTEPDIEARRWPEATSAAGEPALAAFRDRGHSIVVLSVGPLAWLK